MIDGGFPRVCFGLCSVAGVGVCAGLLFCSAPVRVLRVCRPVRVRPPGLCLKRTVFEQYYEYACMVTMSMRAVSRRSATRLYMIMIGTGKVG